jgi:sulfur carrier protein ThiS
MLVNVKLKLFADLMRYLPPHARRQSVSVGMPDGATLYDLLQRFHIPREETHLVICNGLFIPPAERGKYRLREQDIIALWPPVAGG